MTGLLALLLALAGAYGVHLLYTAVALRWEGVGPGPHIDKDPSRVRRGPRDWLVQAGLDDVSPAEFSAVVGVLVVLGMAAGFTIFGALLPALALGMFGGSFPIASYCNRRRTRRAVAQEAWPRMIEEIRILTGSLGRSVPQALFEVGARGPDEMRPAFAAAHREWLISTDFPRTVRVLKDRLADPTADATCETLLVAHEIGGSDLDSRLRELIEDRIQDVQGRKDARSKQAGVRFARKFVLIVPLGMAAAGVSVGEGKEAYREPTGQLAVLIAIGLVVLCWLWAGSIMRIPEEERVFER
ncbi:type II secretion system F family protein [soil metagenome]